MKIVTKPGSGGRIGRRPFATGTIGAAVAAGVLALAGLAAPASAAALAAGDTQCLACHGMAGLEKPLDNGEKLSLQVPGDGFAQSVHNAIGCAGCHADIKPGSHPPAQNSITGRRNFSSAMVQVCRTCHSNEFAQWGQSVHAALAREGNAAAPLCTTCHSPHAVVKGAAEAMDTVPCKTCHADIFTAYTASVHGMFRANGVTAAPLCFGCHGAHEVSVPSAGVGRKDVCLGCHAEALASHSAWLPNTELHFDTVSCPVCHTPQAQRVVDLVLYNSTTQKAIPEPVGVPEFESLTGSPTAAQPGLDPATLMTLLSALNRPGVEGKTSIRGRLEVRTGVEDHQLAVAAKAISNCDTCHRQGAAAFQSVQVSVAGPAGIPIRYGVNKDVLSSVFSINSVGGFYAIGGTRITLLDVLFVLVFVGAVGWSVLHLAARWAFKRFVNQPPHEQPKE
jgi:hypothetical protein